MKFKATLSDEEAFLAHHGTKGMKWGVHNDETKRKYGELGAGAAAGGGVPLEDEEEEEKEDTPGLTSGNFEKDRENVIEGLENMGSSAIEEMLNKHIDDIEFGKISQAEAQILSIINNAATAVTGEPVIRNPKGGTPADNDYHKRVVVNGKVVTF